MNKLTGLSRSRSSEKLNSLAGYDSEPAISFPISQSSDSDSAGSLANMELTAGELVREKTSSTPDLNLLSSKVNTFIGEIHARETKLQNLFMIKVMQKEDERLWKGLEWKFSSTKSICYQILEILRRLARHIHSAEEDKEFFENRFSATVIALDSLNDQMKSLSLKMESTEQTIRNCEKELKELTLEKEKEKSFRDEQCRVANIIAEKDMTIKNFEATAAANSLDVESLNSKLSELHLELRLKYDDLKDLRNSMMNMETEKSKLLSSNEEFAKKLDIALREIKDLEDLSNILATKLNELDKQSLTFSQKVIHINTLFASCFKIIQEKRSLATQHANQQFDHLQDQFIQATSDKDALQLVNENLQTKINELQKEQEFTMVQHAEECRLAEERIRRLDSEAETLRSEITDMEKLIATSEEKIGSLSETSRVSEEKLKDLQLKMSEDNTGKFQVEVKKKKEEIDILRKEIKKHEENLDSLGKQVNQLQNLLEAKEQLVSQLKNKEKQLEDKTSEIQGLLSDTESKLTDAKKQYDQMLESEQIELSRHLKEISQRNYQEEMKIYSMTSIIAIKYDTNIFVGADGRTIGIPDNDIYTHDIIEEDTNKLTLIGNYIIGLSGDKSLHDNKLAYLSQELDSGVTPKMVMDHLREERTEGNNVGLFGFDNNGQSHMLSTNRDEESAYYSYSTSEGKDVEVIFIGSGKSAMMKKFLNIMSNDEERNNPNLSSIVVECLTFACLRDPGSGGFLCIGQTQPGVQPEIEQDQKFHFLQHILDNGSNKDVLSASFFLESVGLFTKEVREKFVRRQVKSRIDGVKWFKIIYVDPSGVWNIRLVYCRNQKNKERVKEKFAEMKEIMTHDDCFNGDNPFDKPYYRSQLQIKDLEEVTESRLRTILGILEEDSDDLAEMLEETLEEASYMEEESAEKSKDTSLIEEESEETTSVEKSSMEED